MPRQESNRAKAARIAREKKRGPESDATQAPQTVQPKATEETDDQLLNDAGGQGIGAEGRDIGDGGQGTVSNETTVFKSEPSEEMLHVRIWISRAIVPPFWSPDPEMEETKSFYLPFHVVSTDAV